METLIQARAYGKNIVHDVEVVGLCITLQSRALIAVD